MATYLYLKNKAIHHNKYKDHWVMTSFFFFYIILCALKETNKKTLAHIHSWRMETGLRSAVSLFSLVTVVALHGSLDDEKRIIQSTNAFDGTDASVETSLAKCTLQGNARPPAFSMDGDFLIGGAFFIHYQMETVVNNYTTKPKLPKCTGRLVKWRSATKYL